MTKSSGKVIRKVTFDVPESDYESDSSDSSDDIQVSRSRHKKILPKESPKKYDPPPLDTECKLKPILKNKNTVPYEEPAITTSLLPPHIINSIINAKFGPCLSDPLDEESDSGNSSDESESEALSSILYLKTKGNLDVESNNSRQNSIEELNREDWLKDLPEVESDDNNNISLVDCLIAEQNLNLEKVISKINTEITINIDPNSSSSSDLSESSENSDKPLAKKYRRVIIRRDSGETDSEESFELDKNPVTTLENPVSDKDSKTIFYNAHEISYLGQQCNDNFDSICVIPEKLSLVSYSDYNNALIRFPPVILQSFKETSEEDPEIKDLKYPENYLEIEEDIKYPDNSENIKYPENNSENTKYLENNSENPFFNQIKSKENINSYLENIVNNIEEEISFDIYENIQSSNQELTCENELSYDIKQVSSPVVAERGCENPTIESSLNSPEIVEPPVHSKSTERQHRISGHKRQRSQNRSNKKRVFTAVRLPSESEEQLPSPTKRNIKPYTKKARVPLLKLVMEHSDSLNCAGEPEVLSPHKRDDIKEKDILIWIYNMIDEPARVDYEFFLKDGCILCKLMNRVKPGCIPEEEITWEGARSKQKNIQNFLIQAENYGVPKAKLFYPEDLLHLRHIPRVTRCIYALAKIAQDDPALGPDTPRLGDEPSFMEPPKKVEIPGHRDTKEVLNQITSTMQKKEDKKTTKHSLYK